MENTINGILQVVEKQINLIFTSRKKKKENKAKKQKKTEQNKKLIWACTVMDQIISKNNVSILIMQQMRILRISNIRRTSF